MFLLKVIIKYINFSHNNKSEIWYIYILVLQQIISCTQINIIILFIYQSNTCVSLCLLKTEII